MSAQSTEFIEKSTIVCNKCNESKTLDQFKTYKSKKRNKSYIRKYCEDCRKKRAKVWRDNNKNRIQVYSSDSGLKSRYGITLKQKKQLFDDQKGLCANPGCQIELKTLSKAMTDHNHKTGQVRALLCICCNQAEGLLKGDIKRIEGLKYYLAKYDNDFNDFGKFAGYLKEREDVSLLETEHGFATYSIRGEECYIKDIYVIPEHRQQGIASSIADKIISRAKEQNCKYITGSVCPTTNNATTNMKVLVSYGMRLHSSQPNLIVFIKDIK